MRMKENVLGGKVEVRRGGEMKGHPPACLDDIPPSPPRLAGNLAVFAP